MERLLTDLLKQTQENSGLLQQALVELHELKQQVQNQKKFPFTVKTCGFEVLFFSKLNFIMLLIHPSLYASDPNSNMILVAHQDLNRKYSIFAITIVCYYHCHYYFLQFLGHCYWHPALLELSLLLSIVISWLLYYYSFIIIIFDIFVVLYVNNSF